MRESSAGRSRGCDPASQDEITHLRWAGAGVARGRDRGPPDRSRPEGRGGRIRPRAGHGRPEERQAAARRDRRYERPRSPAGRQDAGRRVRPGDEAELALLVHMMSAGRLQVFDERASLRDRRSRVLVRFGDGRELRLREFGTKQRAWAKLMAAGEVGGDEMVATLGPEAWPAPALDELTALLDQPRFLHPCFATSASSPGSAVPGSTRSSGRPASRPSPRPPSSTPTRSSAFIARSRSSATRSTTTRRSSATRSPTRCRCRCGSTAARASPARAAATTIAAIHYSERITCYCPEEQTGGKVLADRRLSRLLK